MIQLNQSCRNLLIRYLATLTEEKIDKQEAFELLSFDIYTLSTFMKTEQESNREIFEKNTTNLKSSLEQEKIEDIEKLKKIQNAWIKRRRLGLQQPKFFRFKSPIQYLKSLISYQIQELFFLSPIIIHHGIINIKQLLGKKTIISSILLVLFILSVVLILFAHHLSK